MRIQPVQTWVAGIASYTAATQLPMRTKAASIGSVIISHALSVAIDATSAIETVNSTGANRFENEPICVSLSSHAVVNNAVDHRVIHHAPMRESRVFRPVLTGPGRIFAAANCSC